MAVVSQWKWLASHCRSIGAVSAHTLRHVNYGYVQLGPSNPHYEWYMSSIWCAQKHMWFVHIYGDLHIMEKATKSVVSIGLWSFTCILQKLVYFGNGSTN